MARLSMTEAIASLGAHPFLVADERGGELELVPLAWDGTRLTATADRLRVGQSRLLEARVHGADLRPWVLGLEVESAQFHSHQLAKVVLRARTLRLDQRHRQADRTALGGHARLVAVNCQDVVDGDVVEGSVVDVSDGGVAFLTRRLLRPGDRLTFSGRFFATVVNAEVRVARVNDQDGQTRAGCTFIEISAAERRKLREVARARPTSEVAQVSLRRQLEIDAVDESGDRSDGRLRRMFRRSA